MNAPETSTSVDAAPIRNKIPMSIWDAPVGLANTIYTWAYVALVLGAILTAISTMSLFWASGVRDKFADLQIRTAQDDAAHAIERTKTLELQTAQAQTEQTRLQIELEKEQIERLQFEGQFAWRVIQPSEKQELINSLSQTTGTVNIGFVNSDPEATFFAIELERIFVAAKWQVNMSANTYAGTVFFGLFIPDMLTAASATQSVREAFAAANIAFSTETPPQPPMSFGGGGTTNAAVNIVVGSKPIPGAISALQSLGHN